MVLEVFSIAMFLAAWRRNGLVEKARIDQVQKLMALYRAGVLDDTSWEAAIRMTEALSLELEISILVERMLAKTENVFGPGTVGFTKAKLVVDGDKPLGLLVWEAAPGDWDEPDEGFTAMAHPKLYYWEVLLWWLLRSEEDLSSGFMMDPFWSELVKGNVIEDRVTVDTVRRLAVSDLDGGTILNFDSLPL